MAEEFTETPTTETATGTETEKSTEASTNQPEKSTTQETQNDSAIGNAKSGDDPKDSDTTGNNGDDKDSDKSKAEGGKKEDETDKSEPVTREALAVPEGVELEEQPVQDFLEAINDTNLSRAELAQKLLDLQLKGQEEALQRGSDEWTAEQAKLKKELEEDPVLGANNLQGNLKKVGIVMDKFANDEVRSLITNSGLGNHKAMFDFLLKISNALGEGSPAPGASPSSAATSAAERMYPSMAKTN